MITAVCPPLLLMLLIVSPQRLRGHRDVTAAAGSPTRRVTAWSARHTGRRAHVCTATVAVLTWRGHGDGGRAEGLAKARAGSEARVTPEPCQGARNGRQLHNTDALRQRAAGAVQGDARAQ